MSRTQPYVSLCCCGCSLKTGCLIIGWLQLIGSLLSMIRIIICAVAIHGLNAVVHDEHELYGPLTNGSDSDQFAVFATPTAKVLIVDLVFFCLSAPLSLVGAAALLIGMHKMKASYCNAWLLTTALTLLLNLGAVIGNSVIIGGAVLPPVMASAYLLGLGLSAYFAVVVRSAAICLRNQLPIERAQTVVVTQMVQAPPAYDRMVNESGTPPAAGLYVQPFCAPEKNENVRV